MVNPYISLPREIYNHYGIGLGEETPVGLIASVVDQPDLVIHYVEKEGDASLSVPKRYIVSLYDKNFIVQLQQKGQGLPSRWSFHEEERGSTVREWEGTYGRKVQDMRPFFNMQIGFAMFIAQVNLYAHQKVVDRLHEEAVKHG